MEWFSRKWSFYIENYVHLSITIREPDFGILISNDGGTEWLMYLATLLRVGMVLSSKPIPYGMVMQ
jgi:hypothetical protein